MIQVGMAVIVLSLAAVACGGESRPTQEEWAAAARPVLAEMLVSSSINTIRGRLPGDYVPPAALRACDEMEPQFASWREAMDPGPTEEVDLLLVEVFDGLEVTCSALRAGDIGLAQTQWAQTQAALGELFSHLSPTQGSSSSAVFGHDKNVLSRHLRIGDQ